MVLGTPSVQVGKKGEEILILQIICAANFAFAEILDSSSIFNLPSKITLDLALYSR